MAELEEVGPNYCSHCGDTTSHCSGCGACPGGGHWGGCTR